MAIPEREKLTQERQKLISKVDRMRMGSIAESEIWPKVSIDDAVKWRLTLFSFDAFQKEGTSLQFFWGYSVDKQNQVVCLIN